MSKNPRTLILEGLRRSTKEVAVPTNHCNHWKEKGWSKEKKIETLKAHLESARSEVILTSRRSKLQTLANLIERKKLQSLLYSSQVDLGKEILNHPNPGFSDILREYSGNEEVDRSLLFEVDASVTTAKGAIAENGAIILWPDKNEPRMMSLVPPVHIIMLDVEQIFESFGQAIQEGNWSPKMPTNAVLVSGPSRTADIELILAFGVHGPKEVIVVITK